MSAATAEPVTVAGAVAGGLREAGIDTVFGLPGGENVHLLEAMRSAGIRFVLCEHENAAAFMASAAAQVTRRPAACLTTLGPGAVNCTAGVAHAFLDRCPVLVFTAQMPDVLQPRHTHQLIDLHRLFAPITKATLAVTPRNAAGVVREALRIACAGAPGPVHLQIANDVAARDAGPAFPGDAAADAAAQARTAAAMDEPPATPEPDSAPALPSGAELALAAAGLAAAERPVVVAGLGLEPEAPYAALLAFAERLGAPVLTTPKAKGAAPASHPLGSETIGLTRTDPGYGLIGESDRVIAVGMDVVEVVLPWSAPAPVLWIAPQRDRIGAPAAEQALIGPLRPTLAELTERLPQSRSGWGAERAAHYRQARRRRSRAGRAAAGTVAPQDVLREARAALPPEAVVTTDVGSHKILAALEWDAELPNRYLVSNGLSVMGFGPAAAAGAALAGRAPVLCVTGDAGLLMCAGGLAALAQLSSPVVMLVLLDGALDLIRAHQRRAGATPFGTEFPAPDAARIAAAFGLPAVTVDNAAGVRRELEQSLARAGASVIAVRIDPDCYRGSF